MNEGRKGVKAMNELIEHQIDRRDRAGRQGESFGAGGRNEEFVGCECLAGFDRGGFQGYGGSEIGG